MAAFWEFNKKYIFPLNNQKLKLTDFHTLIVLIISVFKIIFVFQLQTCMWLMSHKLVPACRYWLNRVGVVFLNMIRWHPVISGCPNLWIYQQGWYIEFCCNWTTSMLWGELMVLIGSWSLSTSINWDAESFCVYQYSPYVMMLSNFHC